MSDPASDNAGMAQGELRGVLPAGTTLRGYELKAILGQGAFGITYRARDTTLDRDVAIKEYLPTTLALREGRTTVMPRSPEHAEQFAWGRERFLEEARILARLDLTTAIVRVYDFLEANGTAYMIMALVEGETLAKRLLREQRLTPDAVERMLYPLLDGLEELHAASFLHRDIKPANVMVDVRSRPTLIDFGASRAAMAERSTTLTAIFTPGYAAIEQFTSTNLGPWTDIYGLAATFHHAIAGRIPPSAIERMVNDTLEPLSALQPPGFPPALLAGIDAALAVRGEERPQSIAEWRHMLRSGERLSSQEPTRIARKPGALSRAAGRGRRAGVTLRGPVLWGAAAAAILVLAVGGWLAFQAAAPGGAGPSTLALSTEQLEQVLAERRKADTLAAEKRQLEDEARRRAAAEAEAKRQAETELEQARQARQKAEDDLASLRADIEARRLKDQGEAGQREQAEAALRRAAEESAQRKAEDEAAGLRLAEEDARRKAEADAEAKRQADEALAQAEAERQRAEQAARQKADAEAAALKQASEETQRKAMEAESKRQAEEAQAKEKAERDKAEAEAKAKFEADKAAATLARQKEEAEAAEKGLRLDPADRERLQVALTSLGFDTRGNDGILGPRSRDMIAAWQKARNHSTTGYLNGAQQQALLKEAAPAVSKHDERKKAEEEAKARAASATGPVPVASAPTSPGTAPLGSVPDGTYKGVASLHYGTFGSNANLTVRIINGRGTGTSESNCGSRPLTLEAGRSGEITGETELTSGNNCTGWLFTISGRAEGSRLILLLTQRLGTYRAQVVLAPVGDVSVAVARRSAAAPAPGPSQPGASPPTGGPPSSGGLVSPIGGRVTLAVSKSFQGGSLCGTGRTHAVRIYPSRIELEFSWGWEALGVGEDGSFSGSIMGTRQYYGNVIAQTRLSVHGNTKSKVISIEDLAPHRCVWAGTLP